MAKARGVEAKLARLHSLRKEPISPEIVAELRKFLGDASNFVVADAAAYIGEANLADLAPELGAAFYRFMGDAGETGKVWRGKIGLIEGLNKKYTATTAGFPPGTAHVPKAP